MTKEIKEKFVVGQKLWCVPRSCYGGRPREVTVLKVGRLYLSVSGSGRTVERIFVDTLVGESMSCYLSVADYQRHDRADRAWRFLTHALGRRPRLVTLEQIETAAGLLGITLPVGL